MALGGGTFLTQNKVLPGAYINFVSAAKASATLSDRGYAAMGLELDWGPENQIFEVTNGDFQKNSLKMFGYDYTADELKGLRDLFINLSTLYAYRLTSGGTKAENKYATAKYCGTRGNSLKVVIAANADEEEKFDVSLYIDDVTLLDQQVGISTAAELIDNDYVVWKKEASLAEDAGLALSGGANGTVNGAAHQAFLDKAEAYSFNILGCASTDDTVKKLYVSYTKRMRDEVGAKFQLVAHKTEADYEGVISVENEVEESPVSSLVYWVTGAEAGCAINKSLTNTVYNGEFTVKADYTQSQLEGFIEDGKLTFHKVGEDIRVLTDINSLVTETLDKNEYFKDNQIIRVLDQIGNDIAALFNDKYLGKTQNNKAGRLAFWNEIVTYNRELERLEAITDFVPDDVTVEQGSDKNSVVVNNPITPVSVMTKLYMTCVIS